MAIRKLNKTGIASAIPNVDGNGEASWVLLTHTVSEDIGTGDILEIAGLPADAKVLSLDLDSENVGTTNLTVGFMSGRPGESDPARTCGAEFLNAVPAGTAATVPIRTLANIARDGGNRSIGLRTSAAITAGATKKIHLRLAYAAQPTTTTT